MVYIVNFTTAWLGEMFREHLISPKNEVGTSLAWYEVPKFHLWRFLKDNIYQSKPRTFAALAAVTTKKIQASTQEKYAFVHQYFQLNGAYPKHVILLILIFLFQLWDQIVTDPKMLFAYLSINVISITLSFMALDLCPIILFKKLWNILSYIKIQVHFLLYSLHKGHALLY